MRKLWLHIGSHKTGTTTLQRALIAAKRKELLGDWTYVHAQNAPNLNNAVMIRGAGPDMTWHVKTSVLQDRIPQTGNCIISAERFFWLDSEQEIQRLAKLLKARFDQIKVVAYLRRQDSLALSFRKTAITMLPARQFFGDGISALPQYLPHMDSYFDYAKKMSIWENAFGAGNIVVRRYGDHDTVEDFSTVIGHDLPTLPRKINKSWSRDQMIAAMWLQTRGYSYRDFSSVIAKITDDRKLLPSRSAAQGFVGRFAGSNATLVTRYGDQDSVCYFNDDYSQYPEIGNDTISGRAISLKKIEAKVRMRPVIQMWQQRGRRKLGFLKRKMTGAFLSRTPGK